MVRVLVPTSGGINDRSKRKIPNMVSKISKKGVGESGDAKTLSGQVRSDPRVNPMNGDLPFQIKYTSRNLHPLMWLLPLRRSWQLFVEKE